MLKMKDYQSVDVVDAQAIQGDAVFLGSSYEKIGYIPFADCRLGRERASDGHFQNGRSLRRIRIVAFRY